MARSNDAVAAAVQELAVLLAISGGDPYRVRSCEEAARSIAGFARDLDGLDRKGLMAMPAVGGHIADKLLELRETGRIGRLEELRAQVPAGLRALLGVPGLGPKRAHQVYVELGISSMPELVAALHDQRLRDLKGVGGAQRGEPGGGHAPVAGGGWSHPAGGGVGGRRGAGRSAGPGAGRGPGHLCGVVAAHA